MDSITVLPNTTIENRGLVSEKFINHGISNFHQACNWVKNLPYGFNSNTENSLIIFAENCGTCTTKHGIIARLAEELGLDIHKTLGFYRLNDEIITGVNKIIQPYGLDFIPQVHCFLAYQNFRVDLTAGNCNGKNKPIEKYDFFVKVNPDLTIEQSENYYTDYLEKYYLIEPKFQKIGSFKILRIIEECDRQLKYQCSLMFGNA
ncbi:hypothetical protein [Nodularia spumigena]|jgi:hypothetical protein|uniref:Uncharacterized protein n=1 Tax=Nodularia spumigena UHCC 0060 TaxID=3110300 RepID=A0ABU5UJT8_NODSP|nr:hypothetical protein [Nodularia spumigena]MEA5523687.1 hypothetical protein [Nodularia spumigena UHCC 0143]MEA5555608.1 hypothetical protein [Nodularia spumigena CH309]MEA5606503.1 hypothetical protein [Nodularia spumigena UHCC 0060]MEA5613935.1 hypothetical protein [Nodularia spumigena UHCC 0040]